MDFSRLPGAIDGLIRAVQAKDISAFLSLFTCDSTIVESGFEYRGNSLVDWISHLFRDWDSLQPINVTSFEGKIVITFVLQKEDEQDDNLVAQVEWELSVAIDKISVWIVTPAAPIALPPPVARFVNATNTFNLKRFLDSFADDAVVNDQLHEYEGRAQISNWAAQDIIETRLTMYVRRVTARHGNAIVTANVDGKFDKRGLPDPLVLKFYFTVHHDRIVQLIILRHEAGI